MTTEHAATGLIGASIRRVEDAPLITGRGCYTEDIQLPGTLHMALLRSPLPHAKIVSIDTGAAKAMAGVTAVVIGDDLSKELHVPTVPMVAGMKIPPHPLLARGSVHAIGAPVAAVLAKSRAVAEDADVAVELDVGEVALLGHPLLRVLGPDVAQRRVDVVGVDDRTAAGRDGEIAMRANLFEVGRAGIVSTTRGGRNQTARIDGVDRLEPPKHDDCHQDADKAPAAAGNAARQAIASAVKYVFEIGSTARPARSAARTRHLTPRPAAIVTAAAASIVVPGHDPSLG